MTDVGPRQGRDLGDPEVCAGSRIATKLGRVLTVEPQLPLVVGKVLPLFSEESVTWSGAGTFMDGYALGLLVGDGTIESHQGKSYPRLQVFTMPGEEALSELMKERLLEWLLDTDIPEWHKTKVPAWRPAKYKHSVVTNWILYGGKLRRTCEQFGIQYGNKTLTDFIELGGSDMCRGFLRGVWDADGSVSAITSTRGNHTQATRMQLSNTDLPLLRGVQRMLGRIGIMSSIRMSRDAQDRVDTHIQMRVAQYELNITGMDAIRFDERVGFFHLGKKAKLKDLIAVNGTKVKKRIDTIVSTEEVLVPMVDVNFATINCEGIMFRRPAMQLPKMGVLATWEESPR